MLRNGPNGAHRIDGAGGASASGGDRVAALDDGGSAGAASGAALPRCVRSDEPGLLSLPRLSREALAGLGREGLLGVLSDVERLVNRAAGYRAQVLGALDALSRSGAAPDASPHLTLRDAAGMSERDARRTTRMAEKARAQPAVLEALTDGDINTAQAEALCDARVPDEVREELVAAAAAEDTDATRGRVRQAEAEHCVETSMERFERQRKARGAGWQRDHEGMLRPCGPSSTRTPERRSKPCSNRCAASSGPTTSRSVTGDAARPSEMPT